MSKIIVIDWLVFVHTVGYAKSMPEYGTAYHILNMITSHLKKIGLDKDDIIIIAKDMIRSKDGGCWRNDYEESYKEGRAAQRSQSGRNWKEIWRQANSLLLDFEIAGIPIIGFPRMEADDVMSVITEQITDKEIILDTVDSDLEQLWDRPNVKIFSPKKKYKSAKGAYKIKPPKFDVNKVIAKKIKKEISDGLKAETKTIEEYNNRKLCIDLLRLPDFVTLPLKKELSQVKLEGGYDWDVLPYPKLHSRIEQAYKKIGMITYEDCRAYEEAKKERLKKKKLKEKGLKRCK